MQWWEADFRSVPEMEVRWHKPVLFGVGSVPPCIRLQLQQRTSRCWSCETDMRTAQFDLVKCNAEADVQLSEGFKVRQILCVS